MENTGRYVVLSLELHLFFARIMKEHALFLEAGFTPPSASFAKDAEKYKREFEKLLFQAVSLSNGVIGKDIINSGEIITEFTDIAECQTEKFTGIRINRKITAMEKQLKCGTPCSIGPEMICKVKCLNQTVLRLLNNFISFKENTLNKVLSCCMFTMNYPLLLEHIIREAKLYRTYVLCYEGGKNCDCQSMKQIEQFWNQIMMEHAMFIRGLLDPSENKLVETSDDFAKDYARLLAVSREKQSQTISASANESLQETLKFRDFKAAGAKGIQECQIRSIILPLLADHVLREANHYIHLLNS